MHPADALLPEHCRGQRLHQVIYSLLVSTERIWCGVILISIAGAKHFVARIG
jgi:hypothetical protein